MSTVHRNSRTRRHRRGGDAVVVVACAGRAGRAAGFTLIELLVVIGIIAVLVGILLPTLNRVRAKSEQVTCMSNLRQIGQAIFMYANDNRDHWPGKTTVGGFAVRRQPGLSEPKDPSSYPEWLGLAAVLHGIKPTDFNFSMSQAQVRDGVEQALAQKPRYISARGKVWVCPSYPARLVDYGNTYATSINASQEKWTSRTRGSYKARNVPWVWDNAHQLPYLPGATPGSSLGYSLSPAIYAHRGSEGKQTGRNFLYFDGRVELTETP